MVCRTKAKISDESAHPYDESYHHRSVFKTQLKNELYTLFVLI